VSRSGKRRWGRRILVMLAAAAALFYLGLPIIVKLGTRQPSRLELEAIDSIASHTLSPSVEAYFETTHEALTRDGFALAGRALITNAPGAEQAFVAVYLNRQTGDMAAAQLWVVRLGQAPPTESAALAHQTLADHGREVETSNLAEVPILIQRPGQDVVCLPEVSDAHRLYVIHRKRLERLQLGKGLLPADGDVLRLMAEQYGADMDYHVSEGYWEPTGEPEQIRPTWKGAYYMTWRFIPPGKWLVLGWQSFRNSRLLEELGEP
jgi:hypothetical protein